MIRKQLTVLGTGCFMAMSLHSATALANSDRSLITLDANRNYKRPFGVGGEVSNRRAAKGESLMTAMGSL
jgi:hypothetical protein